MALNRRQYIEQIRRLIYGGFPSEDAEITVNLVNQVLNQAIGYAAQKAYGDNLKIDGIASVNNGFFTTFKSLTVTKDENFLWRVTLPEVPPGIGASEGVSSLTFKSDDGKISYPVALMTMNQASFSKGMREIPNKLIGYQQGAYVYVLSTIQLSQYSANCTMVSGGLSTDLDSVLNVPPDYLTFVTEYLKNYFVASRMMPVDLNGGDGQDFVRSN